MSVGGDDKNTVGMCVIVGISEGTGVGIGVGAGEGLMEIVGVCVGTMGVGAREGVAEGEPVTEVGDGDGKVVGGAVGKGVGTQVG